MTSIRVGVDDFHTIPATITDNGHVRDSWLPQNLADLPDKPPILPTLGRLGDIGLLYPGKRHIFSGPQESAKTLCAYLCAISVIRDGGRVALLDFEMGSYDARARLYDLGATASDLSNLLYLEPDDPATEDRVSLLIGLGPDLVIVDAAAGAYAVQGLDDNKRQDVERLTNLYVRAFWRNGIATIMLDHVVKSTENRGAYAIGSERKVGGADVHLGFSVITPISRGHSGLYKITTHKDRGGYLKRGILAEMELRSDPDTHAIAAQLRPAEEVPDGQVWMPTKVMQHISELLEQQTDTVSRSQLVALAGGKKEIALKAIDHLVRLSYVTETPGARGAKLLESTHPFTVLEWETSNPTPPVPTRSRPVPEQVTDDPFPVPFRGPDGNRSEPPENTSPVPDESAAWTWVDELTPPADPADDDLPL